MRSLARSSAAAALVFATACGAGHGSGVRVTIPPGATMRTASDSLAKAGVVRGGTLFRIYASVRGNDRAIKAGTYLMHRGAGWNYVLDALKSGKGLVHAITIPEGFGLAQIEPLMVQRLDLSIDSIDAAVRDTALLHRLHVPTPTLEGYLFPDTYTFPERTSARTAVEAMVRRFEQVWQPAWTARLDTIHLTRNDVVTLASIVEREARVPAERPVIAAVYLNRLHANMLLQSDPTVQFALGKHVARVFYKDLEVESPYNTYKHPGLPPGPIASPGKPSLIAALYPANVPYLYFVAFPDGHHEFHKDLKDHEQARLVARKAWDSVDVVRRADPPKAR